MAITVFSPMVNSTKKIIFTVVMKLVTFFRIARMLKNILYCLGLVQVGGGMV